MGRASLFFLVLLAGGGLADAQQLSVVHIAVSLLDASRQPTPVPHHALLISEDPPTAPPRRVSTGADGTVDVRLRPGAYTIESDRPVAFQGRTYQWTQRITVRAGADATLDLTAQNAENAAPSTSSSLESDPAFLLNQWNRAVVGVWTPVVHGGGFIVDAMNGVVLTSARIGPASSDVDVELTPEITVRARVVDTDPKSGVSVLQVAPSVVASIPSLAPERAAASKPAVASGQDLVTIAVPMFGSKELVYGAAERVDARGITADLRLPTVSAGGPVFAAGKLVGISATGPASADDSRARWASRVVGVDGICAVLASAAPKLRAGMPPEPTHLPVDPSRAVATDVLKGVVAKRAGSLSPPQMTFNDFTAAFITPVHTFGATQSLAVRGTRQRVGAGFVDVGSPALRPVRDFANWDDYVQEYRPVLLIRVTPKLAESFWAAVARGAAQTQGVALPAMKNVKAAFVRLQAFCGDQEVTPIHPFIIEQRISETESLAEGLYAFDAAALGPQCGTVKLTVVGANADKGDTRAVDPNIIQGLARDFMTLGTTR